MIEFQKIFAPRSSEIRGIVQFDVYDHIEIVCPKLTAEFREASGDLSD